LREEDKLAGRVHHWIGLALHGDGMRINREAVGTQVILSYGKDGKTVRQMREVQIANGFFGAGRPAAALRPWRLRRTSESRGALVWCEKQ